MLKNTNMVTLPQQAEGRRALRNAVLLASTVLIATPYGVMAGEGATYNTTDNVITEDSPIGGNIVVGATAEGKLTIENGALVTNDYSYIGNGAVGTVIVSGWDSNYTNRTLWTTSNELSVGAKSDGYLYIENGAQVRNAYGYIGEGPNTAGTVEVSGGGSEWTNYGSLYVGNQGSGTLTISNSGYVSVGATSSNAVGAVVSIAKSTGSTGTLNIGAADGEDAAAAGYLEAENIEFGAGEGTIVFNHTNTDYSFSADISGKGTIEQRSGVTTLKGNSYNFTGDTNITGGTLQVKGELGGSINVSDSGTLGGTGRVGTTTIEDGGILSPGLLSSPPISSRGAIPSGVSNAGTLMVNGDLTFNSGSTYAVDLSSSLDDSTSNENVTSNALSKSDRVVVFGNVTINNGSKVKVTALDEETSYKTAKTYKVIDTVDGALEGKFSEADTTNSPFLKVTTSYTDNDMYLTVKTSDFVTVATTPNQRSLGAALDSLDQSGKSLELYNSLAVLDDSQVQKTYEQLSGEVYATAQGAFTQTNRAVNTALNSRVRAVTDGVAAPSSMALGFAEEKESALKDDRFAAYEKKAFDTDRFATWINGFGSWGKVSGSDGSSDTDVSNGGVLVGGDVGFGENTRVGVLGGYSRSFFDTDSSNGNSTNYHLGTYVGTKVGAVSLRSGANYTWHDVSTQRSITALGQTLNGDYDGSSFNIYGELAYRFDLGKSALEPFAALAYNRTKTDGFTETGGTAALTVDPSAMNTTYTTMGLRASSDFELGGVASVARGTVGWMHSYGDIDPVSTARFATGDSFSVSSTPIDRNTALLEAGLDFTITPSSTVSLTYNGQIGSNAYDHGANAKFRLKF